MGISYIYNILEYFSIRYDLALLWNIFFEFRINQWNCFKGKIEDLDSTMEKAEAKGIQVVPVDILDEFQADPSNAISLITKKNIAPWGTEVCHIASR